MTLVFMLCFRDSFINNSFDHYIFILGGALKNKYIRVQILEANNFLKFFPKLIVILIIIIIIIFLLYF